MDALAVGVAAWRLGAGRARKEDSVSAAAGVVCLAKPGDEVEEGQPVFELHADSASVLDRASAALDGAIDITDGPVAPGPLVLERIGS
jgi:thymidine phosphorylase